MSKRTEFSPGAVFRVPVGADDFAYAVMLSDFPYVAFFGKDAAFDGVGAPIGPPMFVVCVERSAYVRGGWGQSIRQLPPEALPAVPRFFWQSPVNKAECKIVEPIKHRVTATPAECVGLEPEAVWAHGHLESRIADTYANRPNRFLESLRVKL